MAKIESKRVVKGTDVAGWVAMCLCLESIRFAVTPKEDGEFEFTASCGPATLRRMVAEFVTAREEGEDYGG